MMEKILKDSKSYPRCRVKKWKKYANFYILWCEYLIE